MGSFTVGLDLGQAADSSALTVVEEITHPTYNPANVRTITEQLIAGVEWGGLARDIHPAKTEMVSRRVLLEADGSYSDIPPDDEPSYDLRHAHRWKLGTPYPTIVDDVVTLMNREPLKTNGTLVIDQTGVGAAIGDLLRQHPRRTCSFARVLITGGDTARYDTETGCWHVPKKDLVSVVQVLLQSRRLRFPPASKIPEVTTLISELGTFRTKITAAANEVFGTWREQDHDDMVLSLSMALWYAQHGRVRVRWLG